MESVFSFFNPFITLLQSEQVKLVFKIIWDTLPLWMPVILFFLFIEVWLRYLRADFIRKQGSILLEIKVPREVTRSPLAMEIFFTALYQTGAATGVEAWWHGKIRPWFSLELVSFEGNIHFFIWTWPKYKNIIEAQLYAQFPGVEIYEVPDYTGSVTFDPVNLPFWGTYFKLTRPDAYPIKTYVDYGMHEDPKEEHKVDPMTSILEYLGSMRKGEQVWIQILIQAHKKEGFREGMILPRKDWTDAAKKEIEKIRTDAAKEYGKAIEAVSPGGQRFGFIALTKGQEEAITAIERSIGKYSFECAIRGFYFATKESFDPAGITGLIGSFRQYSSKDLNGFKLGWFSDLSDNQKDALFWLPVSWLVKLRRSYERKMLKAYKMRSFFNAPYKNFKQGPFILTTEEVATIFHLPGEVAATPTFARIVSKKGEAPPNLPT